VDALAFDYLVIASSSFLTVSKKCKLFDYLLEVNLANNVLLIYHLYFL